MVLVCAEAKPAEWIINSCFARGEGEKGDSWLGKEERSVSSYKALLHPFGLKNAELC